MHRDLLQESLYARIYRKNAAPQDRDTQFARACAIEMHMEPPQSKCTWTCPKSHCRKNAAPDKLAALFAQVCAVDMHWDSAQEQFHNGIYRKNGGEQMEPTDPTPALTPAVRTPQCIDTLRKDRGSGGTNHRNLQH